MDTKLKKFELLNERPAPLFLRYLFPSVASTMMVALNFFIDTLAVGQSLGETGIAALNIAQPATGVLYGLGYLFGVGGATLYSAYLGKGENEKAKGIFTTTFVTLVGIAAIIMTLGLVFLDPITTFLGGVGTVRQGVKEYLVFVFWFAVPYALDTFMTTFVRNDNAPRISMMATLIGCAVNIVLDILFLFVFHWGIWGASLATSLAVLTSSGILLFSTLRRKSGLKLRRSYSGKELNKAVRIGAPSFLQEMTGAVVTLAFNSVLLRISGETAVAAYGVMASMMLVVTSALSGVGNAMQPLISANAGAGRQSRVRQILRLAVCCSLSMASVFMLVGFFWPEMLVRVFVAPDALFLSLAVPGVRIVSISYLLMAANILFSVYFQSVQAPGEALLLTILRGIVFPVAMVMGFAVFMGIDSVWNSILLAEGAAFIAALFLFAKVQSRLRAKNYAQLQYFGRKKAQQTLPQILAELGTEDLISFQDMISCCNERDENTSGVPAYLGLDDLTSDYEGEYTPAYDDEDMGLLLAVGALLLSDLYEQDDSYMREKKRDESYPAAAPAMSALAEKCFRFTYDEETDESTIIAYSSRAEEALESAAAGTMLKPTEEAAK